MPLGWQAAVGKFSTIDWDSQQSLLALRCNTQNIPIGQMTIDGPTGLLREVEIPDLYEKEKGSVKVYLGNDGQYHAQGIKDVLVAIPLMGVVTGFLNNVNDFRGDNKRYATIDGDRGRYYSRDLFIPDECFEQEVLTTKEYQGSFLQRARDIAGQFDNTVGPLRFDEQGILTYFCLKYGNATSFTLNDGFGGYSYNPHNVDNAFQAAALHGVAAAFINDMLDQGHTYTPFGIYDDE